MMLLRKQFIVRREWEKLRWGAFIKGKESICSAWYIRLKKDSVICTTWLTKTFLSLQTFYYQKSIFVCCVLMRTGFHKLLFLSNYFLYHVGAFRGKIQDLDWFCTVAEQKHKLLAYLSNLCNKDLDGGGVASSSEAS